MKRFLCVCMLCFLCMDLTACSPHDVGYKVTEFTTILGRKFTECRELLKVKFDEFTHIYEIEKDNVENLVKNRNLDKPDYNGSEDANTEKVTENVTSTESFEE